MDKTNPKDLMGVKKDQIHLVPTEGIRGIARAMYYGAHLAKRADGGVGYGEFNWRDNDVQYVVYLDAIMRHTMALLDGEDLDKDSGLPHEDHIGANISIIKDAKKHGCLIDNRPTTRGATNVALAATSTRHDYPESYACKENKCTCKTSTKATRFCNE